MKGIPRWSSRGSDLCSRAASQERKWPIRDRDAIRKAHPFMTHANALRAIGQLLESANIGAFELEKTGQDYVVQRDSLTRTGEWILRNALSRSDVSLANGRQSAAERSLCFTQPDISRLDAQGKRRRREHSSAQTQSSRKLSQLLRSLGDHLDKRAVVAFHISWTHESVSADYQGSDGESDRRTFTPEKLQQLGLYTRFRRSHPSNGTGPVKAAR